MDRTVYITIGKKEYPMRFSLMASKMIAQKYGSIPKMADKISGMESDEEGLEDIAWILELLIKQGCAYKNLFEADAPIPENAPVQDGKYIPADTETIEVGLELSDLGDITGKIYQCVTGGKERTVETEEPKKDEKNVETT